MAEATTPDMSPADVLAVKERPILFSGPMVRALLSGHKAQTRRVVKTQTGDLFDIKALVAQVQERIPAIDSAGKAFGTTSRVITCPYGQPGDRLWVRESGKLLREAFDHNPETKTDIWRDAGFVHTADNAIIGHPDLSHLPPVSEWIGDCSEKSCPSIHMPRWASRLTLEITEVRVERLQDISEGDAAAEGVPESLEADTDHEIYCTTCNGHGLHASLGQNLGVCEVECRDCDSAVKRYQNLWNHINGKGSWDANPWVWAVSFRVLSDEESQASRLGGEA